MDREVDGPLMFLELKFQFFHLNSKAWLGDGSGDLFGGCFMYLERGGTCYSQDVA